MVYVSAVTYLLLACAPYSYTVVSCTKALRNPHGIRTEFPKNSSDFVKFLVTSTVSLQSHTRNAPTVIGLTDA